MNEQELAGKITQHLERGLGNIKQGTLYQLQSARKAALDRYCEPPQPGFGLAWAGNAAFHVTHSRYFNARNLLVLGLLLFSLIGVTYWQMTMQGNENADIDTGLLAGDLPINAYLDGGFEAWLKRSSQ